MCVCLSCFSLFLLWQYLEIWTNKAAANLEKQLNQLRAAVQPQPPCKEDIYAFELYINTGCSFQRCSLILGSQVLTVYLSLLTTFPLRKHASLKKADPVFWSSVVVALNSFETSPGSVYVHVCS